MMGEIATRKSDPRARSIARLHARDTLDLLYLVARSPVGGIASTRTYPFAMLVMEFLHDQETRGWPRGSLGMATLWHPRCKSSWFRMRRVSAEARGSDRGGMPGWSRRPPGRRRAPRRG